MAMQSHLHNDGVGASAEGALPAGESKEEERADDGDGGVGVVGWGEARV